jgi:hypothetical protein
VRGIEFVRCEKLLQCRPVRTGFASSFFGFGSRLPALADAWPRRIHAADLAFECTAWLRDAVLAGQIRRFGSSLVLAQDGDNLLFREPDPLLVRPLIYGGRTLTPRGGKTQWQGTG